MSSRYVTGKKKTCMCVCVSMCMMIIGMGGGDFCFGGLGGGEKGQPANVHCAVSSREKVRRPNTSIMLSLLLWSLSFPPSDFLLGN
jgi:hypothetical protein